MAYERVGVGMSSKSKKKPSHDMSMNKAITNALIIFLWAFCAEFSPDPELVERMKHQISSVRESVMKGSLTIANLRKALKEDYDWEVY